MYVHTPPVNVAESFEVQKEYDCFELILPENTAGVFIGDKLIFQMITV